MFPAVITIMTICIIIVVGSAVLFIKTNKFKYVVFLIASGWVYYATVMFWDTHKPQNNSNTTQTQVQVTEPTPNTQHQQKP